MDYRIKIIAASLLILVCISACQKVNTEDYSKLEYISQNVPPDMNAMTENLTESDLWNIDSIHFEFSHFSTHKDYKTAVFISDNFQSNDTMIIGLPLFFPTSNTGFYFQTVVYMAINKSTDPKYHIFDWRYTSGKIFCKYRDQGIDLFFSNWDFYPEIRLPGSNPRYYISGRMHCPKPE